MPPRVELPLPGGAVIDHTGQYRYVLSRQIFHTDRITTRVLFVMLNPSKADATRDDHTVRKLIGFCKRWGKYEEALVVNAFAYRATHPLDLRKAIDPVGWYNDAYIRAAAAVATDVVVAWGSRQKFPPAYHLRRPDEVLKLLKQVRPKQTLLCLGTTKFGDPCHPLTLAYSTQLKEYTPR